MNEQRQRCVDLMNAMGQGHRLELRPDDPNVVLNRAGCLARMGSPEKALPSLDRALELEPEEPRSRRMRSAVMQAMGERPAG